MRSFRRILAIYKLALLAIPCARFAPIAISAPLEDSVATILSTNCVRCHHGPEPKGGLNLSTREGMLRGGDNGAIIKIGAPDESLIIKRVTEGSMPPIGDGDQLPVVDIATLRMWIQSGADWSADRVLRPAGAPGALGG